MQNFEFHAYTDMLFGEGQIEKLPEVLARYGKRVLLTYGGGSLKKNGIYDKIKELTGDFEVTELGGIEPNPRLTSVEKGVSLCREHQIDVILAAGGGSTIDCSKMIAAGACSEEEPWTLVKNPQKIQKALPIVTILTMGATGSEMNGNAVITNMETQEKLGTFSWKVIPQVSICDPTYLKTLPALQTAAGTADIMSHVFEDYFKTEPDAMVQDTFAEGILRTCIKYCPAALKNPADYAARANLMWASSMGLNGLCGSGKPGAWTCHPIEHELSAFYDITHGVGLAILTPRWMRYVLNENTVDKFAEYARNVWHLEDREDKFALAEEAIYKTETFFRDCGIPMTLTELGIDESKFERMAENAVRVGNLKTAFMPLAKEDVVNILKMCL